MTTFALWVVPFFSSKGTLRLPGLFLRSQPGMDFSAHARAVLVLFMLIRVNATSGLSNICVVIPSSVAFGMLLGNTIGESLLN